jgi:histone deacetylase 1/2
MTAFACSFFTTTFLLPTGRRRLPQPPTHLTAILAARNDATLYKLLLGHDPSYDHLRVFGCLCYPNLTTTAANKLSPCSVVCIFLGYPTDTKGYQCLDPQTNCVIVSRHVYFEEDVFPFRSRAPDAHAPSSPPSDDTVPPPVAPHVATCRAPIPRPLQGATLAVDIPPSSPAVVSSPSTPAQTGGDVAASPHVPYVAVMPTTHDTPAHDVVSSPSAHVC